VKYLYFRIGKGKENMIRKGKKISVSLSRAGLFTLHIPKTSWNGTC
jgi:hypothetical protein